MTKLSEELIERLDDQSRRYQSVILTLPEWADIRASLHPAPTAADTPYDPTTQPYDEPFRHVAADTGGLVERLTAENRGLEQEVAEEAALRVSAIDRMKEAEQQLAAAREQIDALEQRNVETQMLTYKWMEAHDKRAAGKPYDLPTTTDVPDTIAALSSAHETIRAMRELLQEARKYVPLHYVEKIDAALTLAAKGDGA